MMDRPNPLAPVRAIALLLALTFALPAAAAPGATQTRGPQSLTVALDDNYPPTSSATRTAR